MTETYRLDEIRKPAYLPCPHDCLIKEIRIEDDFLTLIFEDDISYHDSFEAFKTLKIRYHLPLKDCISVLEQKIQKCFFKKKYYFVKAEPKDLIKMTKVELSYLYHFVGYREIIIELASPFEVFLNIETDYAEYEWIEKEK